MKNFALTGAAGFVAPRYLRAIRDTGNQVLAALDPNDSVGRLDQHGFDRSFFTVKLEEDVLCDPSRVLTNTRCLDQPEEAPS